MKTDIEIAQSTKTQHILKIAKKLGLKKQDLIFYGNNKAKILKLSTKNKAKLILVTSINPTKAGEGKTTVAIGLADALARLGKKTCLALREPSLGPVFGIKGGATGGGYSQILPMDEINLHFTGDFHAITSANNLLCAMIDNHIFQGNALNLDPDQIMFHRCLDINDRALREISLNTNRQEKFVITAASEIMAILSLAKNLEDLKNRLSNILIGLTFSGEPIYAKDLKAVDAMAILLKDALKPNLVQTLAGTPALVHCGPFANIAHGCNSIIATQLASSLTDYVVTEAGFGVDLGAEKFLDLKCRILENKPNCVVIVCTLRAIKLHGNVTFEDLQKENLPAIKLGVKNLLKHIDTIKNVFNLPYVVTLNKFTSDSKKEIEYLKSLLTDKLVLNEVWAKGGEGGIELAKEVLEKCNQDNSNFRYAYDLSGSVKEKIENIAKKIYGAKKVTFSAQTNNKLKLIKKLGIENYPIIIAKTQYSLSANEKLLNCPENFNLEVNDIEIRNGAKFLVAICGKILLMPGLSKTPNANNMKIDTNENIFGLF